MKRPKAITSALAELGAAGNKADKQEALATLRTALAGKSPGLVSQAAELAARLDLGELSLDLRAAFDRFAGEGMGSDKQCQVKTAVVEALHRLRSDQVAVFVEGMGCYWPARPYIGGRDEATRLRIASAIAYAELGPRTEEEPLADLLADPVSDVRLAAVRSLVALGGPHGPSLIRLKTLFGDDDPSVMEECFAGLLDYDKEHYLPFIARYMESDNPRLSVAAALALGRSRHPRALDLLSSQWRRVADPDLRRDLLVAIALLRNEPAIAFLLSLLRGHESTSRDALVALSHLQALPHFRERVEEEVGRSDDPKLRRLFEQSFIERR